MQSGIGLCVGVTLGLGKGFMQPLRDRLIMQRGDPKKQL
jgi:hypothetical protein